MEIVYTICPKEHTHALDSSINCVFGLERSGEGYEQNVTMENVPLN